MFLKAKPVFLKNLRHEMNISACFRSNYSFNGKDTIKLMIAGATFYKIFINGLFVGYGPARAARGYARVDEIDISAFSTVGKNRIEIEVSSYNCDTFYGINIPGFLQAEIISGDNVVISTPDDFSSFLNKKRVQKAMRYSYQRHFSEIYCICEENLIKAESEIVKPEVEFLKREAPLPCYNLVKPTCVAYKGKIFKKPTKHPYLRFIDNISDDSKCGSNGFPKADIKFTPLYDMMDAKYDVLKKSEAPQLPITVNCGEYIVFDMGRNTTGFIRECFSVLSDTCRIVLGVNERDNNGIFLPAENEITNVIDYYAKEGTYTEETFETYGFRYLYFFVLEGKVQLNSIDVREYKFCLESYPSPKTNNKKLIKIYEAGVETFCQNTLDVFMDCPTRERAGWFMDSLFTARSEYFLTGKTIINDIVLDNIVMAKGFPDIPDGMIPMCYPAETMGTFIPQWAMWYAIEVYEHVARTGKSPEKYRGVLYGIYDWLMKHENRYGLLENLEGWNFVEWSKCNDEDWIRDVNYPTNMLYFAFLDKISELYDDEVLHAKALTLKEKIISMSFNGEYFVENAAYDKEGILSNTDNVSETCQYYAVWSGVAELEREEFAALKDKILNVFGPYGTHDFIDYEPSNAFNGIYLRMDILLHMKEKELLTKEIEDFFYKMAVTSGTLWEHKTTANSMNHGFASWITEVIYKLTKM